MNNGIDPIADDELLYRRIPASLNWYDPTTGVVKPEAFGPHKQRDQTGLSVSRAKFGSAEQEAERGRPGKTYYIAILRTGDIRQRGMGVVAKPDTPSGYDAAHAELPDLNASNYKSDETLESQRILADELCLRVEGPFTVPAEL